MKERMFRDAFRKVDGEERRSIVARANAALDAPFDPDTAKTLLHPLPFYEGHSLVILSRDDQYPGIERNLVLAPDGAIRLLDWTNGPIYALNDSVPLVLSEEMLADYLRFFLSFVRGPEGRFLVIESVDDINWREEPSPAGRKALARMVEPVRYVSHTPDGTAVLTLCFIFKDSLLAAEAHISKNGRISLAKEEILVENIPVADDLYAR